MILVRGGDVSGVVESVRQELLRLDPSILYVYARLPHQAVMTQIRPWRLGASVFVLFGALALIVAGVGLYSVVSYLVTQRRQEIGVRIALGARPRDIVRMVVADGMVLVGAGLAAGLVLSLIGGRGLSSLLFATSPTDPVVFATVIVTISIVAMAAAWSPARRARRVDPLEALRTE
jgi:ABC-type antimicrobial peptide transport system permease subunit